MAAYGRRVPAPLIGPSGQGRAIGQSCERTINFYAEGAAGNPKAPVALLQTPGRRLAGAEFDNVIRGWLVMGYRFFAVEGGNVWEIFASGDPHLWGTIPSVSGRVCLSSNGKNLIIGDGAAFRCLDLTAGTIAPVLIDGTDVLRGTFSDFVDGRTVYLERDSQRAWYSDVNAPATVQGLSFFEAEVFPDNATVLLVDREILYIGGPQSIQPFYNSTDPDNPFQPVGEGVIPYGVASPWAFRSFRNGLVFVSTTADGAGRIMGLGGPANEPVVISTPAVNRAMTAVEDLAEITAYTYEEEGHEFAVFNLPGPTLNSPGITWAFDAAGPAGMQWAERGIYSYNDGLWHRDRDELHAYVFGRHYTSDYKRGQYYIKSLDILTQELHPNIRLRILPIDTQGQFAVLDRFEVDMKVGVGRDGTGQGTDPKIMCQVSRDGGRTWDPVERTAKIGALGQTFTTVEFWRLGRARDFALRLSVSEEIEVQLLRAWATLRV